MYCIYRIINKLNGKTYIGQHKYKDLSNDKYMGSGKYLWSAIEKYGIENFEREILVSEINTLDEINKLEIKYIKLERESGHSEYNISNGGRNPSLSGENHPMYGKHRSEDIKSKISNSLKGKDNPMYDKHPKRSNETRIRMSNSKLGINNPMYGKHHSDEVKNKLSELLSGENHPMYGKHLSDEHKDHISESMKGKHHTEETKSKISRSISGRNHPFYGKYHTEISKMKMSESAKNRIGKKYYNNGIECHLFIPGTEPKGYILGHINSNS